LTLGSSASGGRAGINLDTSAVKLRKSMTTDRTIEVVFQHPRDSGNTLTADVSTLCTGKEALQELMRDADGSGSFLAPLREGQNYTLSIRRTEQEIGPDMSFAQAGAVDGDHIVLGEYAVGGGPGWIELGQMVFWSAAAASIFLRSASPLLIEFLRGRSSRSIRIRDGEYEIEITGESPEKAPDILEMLKNKKGKSLNEQRAGSSDRLASPITVTLRDSKAADSSEAHSD